MKRSFWSISTGDILVIVALALLVAVIFAPMIFDKPDFKSGGYADTWARQKVTELEEAYECCVGAPPLKTPCRACEPYQKPLPHFPLFPLVP